MGDKLNALIYFISNLSMFICVKNTLLYNKPQNSYISRHTHRHTHTYTHTHVHMCIHKQKHIHKHTHTHTQTFPYTCISNSFVQKYTTLMLESPNVLPYKLLQNVFSKEILVTYFSLRSLFVHSVLWWNKMSSLWTYDLQVIQCTISMDLWYLEGGFSFDSWFY